ncbi:GntR family transcriptional regulator [Brevibacterium daeguense]|uniref:GntR family transcriptional regulator n=1 Tax=Brevibacterium daeguense TaxID=909936 RepID=A0ABP8EKP0_9MICO
MPAQAAEDASSLRQRAVGAVRARISAGRLRPGQKLNEQVLAGELQISRNTLREAFATLAEDGIILRIPHRGVFISSPGAADITDIYGARAALEPAALLWGSQRDLPRLAEVVAVAEAARARGDDSAVADANQEFHRRVVAGVGSPTLDETMERLLARMRLVFVRVLEREPEFHGPFVDENRAVVELLAEGRTEEAADRLRRSIECTGRELVRIFD